MTAVVLSFPDGRRQVVFLMGVPRVGDHVRLLADGQSLVVEHVLWLECVRANDPSIVIAVHPATAVPDPQPQRP